MLSLIFFYMCEYFLSNFRRHYINPIHSTCTVCTVPVHTDGMYHAPMPARLLFDASFIKMQSFLVEKRYDTRDLKRITVITTTLPLLFLLLSTPTYTSTYIIILGTATVIHSPFRKHHTKEKNRQDRKREIEIEGRRRRRPTLATLSKYRKELKPSISRE